MAETATIRVDREVRDELARLAREQNTSIAGLLRSFASQAERERRIRSEREARLRAENLPEVWAEDADWDSTVGDGID